MAKAEDTTPTTTEWMKKVGKITDRVEKRLPAGPLAFQPHDEETGASDMNYLYADLAAEPDPQPRRGR